MLLLVGLQLRQQLGADDLTLLGEFGWKVVALAVRSGGGRVIDTTGA